MNKYLVPGLLTTVILLAAGLFIQVKVLLSPPQAPSSPTQYFSITPGQTASQIAFRLHTAGLIRSSTVFRLYLRLYRLDAKIKPGGFTLSPSMTASQIAMSLIAGPKDIWVTLPEGWRAQQIASRLAANIKGFDPNRFVELSATLEGRLFPDTYLLPTDLSPSAAATAFVANFYKKTSLSFDQTYPITTSQVRLNLSGQQVVILASLVEREATGPSDRPVIAGILIKRLAAGWPLQIDASVQYARDSEICKLPIENCKFWEPISDTHLVSPFNTYLHSGLPPAPIANPGLSSINSVLQPQSSPYWYYLHTPDGTARFAATLEEHNRNIDKYLTP